MFSVCAQLLFHLANATTKLFSVVSDLLNPHFESALFFTFLVNILFSLRNPDLADFVFLLEVYYQLVLPFYYDSVFLHCYPCIFEFLFERFG